MKKRSQSSMGLIGLCQRSNRNKSIHMTYVIIYRYRLAAV